MRKIFIYLVAIAFIVSSCATVTRFNQTCLTCVSSQRLSCQKGECPTSFLIGGECYVTMIETGENIYLNDILKEENIEPRNGINFTLAKYNGRYFVFSDSFKKMWLLEPHKRNTAKIKAIGLPENNLGIVIFEIYDNQLKMRNSDGSKEFIFNDEKDKWINVKPVQAGE